MMYFFPCYIRYIHYKNKASMHLQCNLLKTKNVQFVNYHKKVKGLFFFMICIIFNFIINLIT